LTGITQKDVAGHKIDVEAFQAILDEADMAIAFNAQYDRGFVEKIGLKAKKWACAYLMIPWKKFVLGSNSQRSLVFEHGAIPSSHQALTDIEDLWWLLLQKPSDRLVKRPAADPVRYLNQLLEASKEQWYIALAHGAPMAAKEFLKKNGFQWQGKPPWMRIFPRSKGGEIREILMEAKCNDTSAIYRCDPTDPGLIKKYFPNVGNR
jgi:DNA polymerase-3 subunit epsilon